MRRPSQTPVHLTPVVLIEKTRDGQELTPPEIDALISQFLSGALTDYQMTEWLMAAFLRGLTDREMVSLTSAMLHSGELLTFKTVKAPKIDKHSTGGVGDKVSLPLAPLVAAAGVAVPMISGRGLGHTGGTLDKLEAIPGFNTRLSAKVFEQTVARIGCSIIGQTAQIAPADRRIYALRDVTGTVACRPLIVASILSKKLAAGLDGLVLDVKVGRGAFMSDLQSARALAESLVSTARALGTKATALLTNMDVPLGTSIGNALEVRESIEILKNEGPADTRELTLRLASEMLVMARSARDLESADKKLRGLLASGHALERFAMMIEAQGGDPRVTESTALLPSAPHQVIVRANARGTVTDVDPRALAEVALNLGAGRLRAEDPVHPGVGLEILAKPGVTVDAQDALVRLHARSKREAEKHVERVRASFRILRQGRVSEPALVFETISSKRQSRDRR